MLADWFDNGRIDRLYPLNCYEEAIDAIPADLRDYADAEEIITRALQARSRRRTRTRRGRPDSGRRRTLDDPSGGSDDPVGPGRVRHDPQAAPGVDTSGPSSVPIPLLVLGGMSLALLAAGGLGYLSRRRQAAHADDDVDDDPLEWPLALGRRVEFVPSA